MNIERRSARPSLPSAEEFEEQFRQAFGREMTADERRYFFLGTDRAEEIDRARAYRPNSWSTLRK